MALQRLSEKTVLNNALIAVMIIITVTTFSDKKKWEEY